MTQPNVKQPNKATCRVCKKEEICHLGPGGSISFLPRGWDRFEDKTLDRSQAMTEVCSDTCKRTLKEWNRSGRAHRMGF